MFSGSWIELSRSALENNINMIRGILGESTRLSSVIKGNAYGHGALQVLGMLQNLEVNHFSVFNADEAYRVFPYLRPHDTLLVMGDLDGDALEWAIQNGIHFFVFGRERLENALEIARKTGQTAKIHLEVETGMNRTGFPFSWLKEVYRLFAGNPELELTGLCTHFAGAESIANYHRIHQQIRHYRKALKRLEDFEIPAPIRHTSCSAGILRYPKMNQDLARVGILQYGLWPNPETKIEFMTRKKIMEDPLRRIISWKSRVMNVKKVKRGQFIGYGTSYQAPKDMEIAVIPVGYAHGYRRDLSNQGVVLIHGRRARVVGNVNMNALSVDISDIPGVLPGTVGTLIGNDGDDAISVASFSELSNQLNYELLTRLPVGIPRHLVD